MRRPWRTSARGLSCHDSRVRGFDRPVMGRAVPDALGRVARLTPGESPCRCITLNLIAPNLQAIAGILSARLACSGNTNCRFATRAQLDRKSASSLSCMILPNSTERAFMLRHIGAGNECKPAYAADCVAPARKGLGNTVRGRQARGSLSPTDPAMGVRHQARTAPRACGAALEPYQVEASLDALSRDGEINLQLRPGEKPRQFVIGQGETATMANPKSAWHRLTRAGNHPPRA